MINKKWCDPRNISILTRSCLPHLEHISIICHPFYLAKAPQADTIFALSKLHDVLSGNINRHPEAVFIIARAGG